MSEHDSHASFIKTPQQLIVVVLLSFIVPVIAIMLIVKLVLGSPSANPAAMDPKAVAARLQPVDQAAATAAAPAAKSAAAAASGGKPDGKKIYDASCMACHATGAANAPKLGDKAAWAQRLKAGTAAMIRTATTGKGAMPPKGGNASLTDAELRAAVEYIISQSK